jgi:hypothetical protein
MSIEDLTKDQKFQAFAMRRTIDHKIVHPKKMLNDFTVKVLVESLATISNERRAELVQKCTGMKRGSALKMSVEESIRAIEIALIEGDTNAEEIFDDLHEPKGISESEIIRFFPPDRVFNTWFYSGFITAEGEDDQALMSDLWDFIIEHKLLGEMTALQLAQDLGLHHFVSDKCPIEKRAELVLRVLHYGEPMLASSRPDGSSSSANANKARPFSAIALFSVVKPADLVKYVRLSEMSKPLEEMAKTKGWLKTGLPPEALDSVIPPPGTVEAVEASLVPPPLPTAPSNEGGEAPEEVEDLDAVDGDGVEITLDGDGDGERKSSVSVAVGEDVEETLARSATDLERGGRDKKQRERARK